MLAQLRLEAPVFVFAGDRLTVRDWSEQHTLAGRRRARSRRDPAGVSPQRATAVAGARRRFARTIPRIRGGVRRSRHCGSPVARVREDAFSQEEIDAAAGQLIHAGTVVTAGTSWSTPATWTRAVQRAAELIDDAHRAHPERLVWR